MINIRAICVERVKESLICTLLCINGRIEKDGFALNIDMDDNSLNFDLAKSVGEFFRLRQSEMETIIEKFLTVVSDWKSVAKQIGIFNKEQLLMESAFNTEL